MLPLVAGLSEVVTVHDSCFPLPFVLICNRAEAGDELRRAALFVDRGFFAFGLSDGARADELTGDGGASVIGGVGMFTGADLFPANLDAGGTGQRGEKSPAWMILARVICPATFPALPQFVRATLDRQCCQ